MDEYVRVEKALAATSAYVDLLSNARMPISDTLRKKAAEFENIIYDAVTGKETPEAEYARSQLRYALGLPERECAVRLQELQESLRAAVLTGKMPRPSEYRTLKLTIDLMLG